MKARPANPAPRTQAATPDWRGLFDSDFLARLERLAVLARCAAGGRPTRQTSGRPRRGVGDSLEFADHRAYGQGDEPRFVDWSYYARSRRLLVRQFHRHVDALLAVLVDSSASMGSGGGRAFDYARKLGVALAMVGVRSGRRVLAGVFPDAPTADGSGSADRRDGRADRLASTVRVASMVDLNRAMAMWFATRPAGKADLKAAATMLGACRAGGADVVVISDLLDWDDLDGSLRELSRRGAHATVIHLLAEDCPPAGPVRLMGAEGGRVELDVTDALLAQYRRRHEAHRRACRRACLAGGADYVEAPIDWPLERLMLTTLRQSGLLGA